MTKKPARLRKGPAGVHSLLQATGKLGIPGAHMSPWGRMSGTDRVRERPWALEETCSQASHCQHWMLNASVSKGSECICIKTHLGLLALQGNLGKISGKLKLVYSGKAKVPVRSGVNLT